MIKIFQKFLISGIVLFLGSLFYFSLLALNLFSFSFMSCLTFLCGLLFLYVLFSLLLKQLVTMEVIQWTGLWNTYKDEFESEKNLLGGPLVPKAAEDLKLRIIEHVRLFIPKGIILSASIFYFYWSTDNTKCHIFFFLAEYFSCVKILFKDHLEKAFWSTVPQFTGLFHYCA